MPTIKPEEPKNRDIFWSGFLQSLLIVLSRWLDLLQTRTFEEPIDPTIETARCIAIVIVYPLSVLAIVKCTQYIQRRMNRNLEAENYECHKCGYCLFGNISLRCPECGAEILEDQRRTIAAAGK